MDIVADTNQYIDLSTTNSGYKGRITFSSTNHDLKVHINSNTTTSLTWNIATLTTNSIACVVAATNDTPTVQCVFMGTTTESVGNIDMCGTSGACIAFTSLNSDFKAIMLY